MRGMRNRTSEKSVVVPPLIAPGMAGVILTTILYVRCAFYDFKLRYKYL